MFKPIDDDVGLTNRVQLTINDTVVEAPAGQMLAITLLQAGVQPFRLTTVSAQPRAPMCLMGVCFDCLVEVDRIANVQSCMVHTYEGMTVRLQAGAPACGGEV